MPEEQVKNLMKTDYWTEFDDITKWGTSPKLCVFIWCLSDCYEEANQIAKYFNIILSLF